MKEGLTLNDVGVLISPLQWVTMRTKGTCNTVPVLLSQTYEPRAGRKYGRHWDRMDSEPKTRAHTGTRAMDTTQTDRQTGKHTYTQTGRERSQCYVCTSTTLSNMCARGRKDSMTSSEVV